MYITHPPLQNDTTHDHLTVGYKKKNLVLQYEVDMLLLKV